MNFSSKNKQIFLSSIIILLVGVGCASTDQPKEGREPANLSVASEEVQIIPEKDWVRPNISRFAKSNLDYPYLQITMDDERLFESLFIYDLENKRVVADFGNKYDPTLMSFTDQRSFLVFNPPGSQLEEGKISVYDVNTKEVVETSLEVSLVPVGMFDVDQDNIVIIDTKNKKLDLYKLSDPRLPEKIITLSSKGFVENVELVYPWVIWSEKLPTTDNLAQIKINLYNIKTGESKGSSHDYFVQASFATDGNHLAYVGQTGACTIDLKDPNNLDPQNFASNIKKDCTPGEIRKDIVITDFSGNIIDKISIPKTQNAVGLDLDQGILVWQQSGLPNEMQTHIRFYDIASKKLSKFADPNEDIQYSKPKIAEGSVIYYALDRSNYTSKGRIMKAVVNF